MKKLIVASNNKHKIEEIKAILKELPIEVISLKDAGINIDVEETGETFEENALIKAEAIFNIAREHMVLADDSGLMVEALGGAPGVYSARYAGTHGADAKNNEKLLQALQGKKGKERRAKFVCAIACIVEENKTIQVQGEVYGEIAEELHGADGFGYDPLFYIEDYHMTFAQMSKEQKNKISHRAVALEEFKKQITKEITKEL